jgi:hypothetical protein
MGAGSGRTCRRPSLIIARITLAETVAAITRRERGGTLSPADAATVLADFQLDFARHYFIIEVSAPVVDQAAALARKHGLRGYDAVQLAAALGTQARLPSACSKGLGRYNFATGPCTNGSPGCEFDGCFDEYDVAIKKGDVHTIGVHT